MHQTRKLPGQTKYPEHHIEVGADRLPRALRLVPRRDQGKDRPPKSGSIILSTSRATKSCRWNFFEAWPTKWDGPDFSAKGTDVAIETLELAHERVERA